MTAKELAKYHAQMYDKPIEWSEAWLKSFMDCIYDMLIREDVDSICLPYIGVIAKNYIFPRTRYDMNKREYFESPGRMTLTYRPSGKLKDKIRALPPNPELADRAKKRRRNGDMPEKIVPGAAGTETETEEVFEDE